MKTVSKRLVPRDVNILLKKLNITSIPDRFFYYLEFLNFIIMKCNKCENISTITLRKKDTYCGTCFLNNTNHKFRACLGKSKILAPNEKVLVCLSGGLSSTVLVDLVYTGVMTDSHKKLRINPVFFHVIENRLNDHSGTEKLLQNCQKYGINLYISHISEYMQTDIKLPVVNTLPDVNEHSEKQFQSLLSSMSATISNDFIQKIRRDLFIAFAKLLACNSIITGEYTSTLAINLLSGIAMGQGSHLEDDVGFCDKRNNNVKVLRPMRDISKEELDNYVKIKHLDVISATTGLQENSLHYVVRNYVNELQDNSQATISTVCKTAGKIGFYNQSGSVQKCVICESALDNGESKLTALDATNFSRGLSSGFLTPAGFVCDESKTPDDEDLCNSMFPFIDTHLCYSCSKNYSEMENDKLPIHIKRKFMQD